ncbi:hypothetical protein TSAR_001888 [Trichomalopsis sarcophagae]|uniref:26S proteasome non-ATPase regulatory subunit 14 n=1 Tax=Trichomalopsis sarcophagae TaxID=543379 RepID=A0A232FJK9_9HYME|nr:hypothetical protein TSAR_001888 [Trichomalopsis sarcophagae]
MAILIRTAPSAPLPPPSVAIGAPTVDTAEQVYISSLALLKMLKHGRAGVPMEVMGLMLGEFVDDYTIRVYDVFAMPQSGTGVSVEAVDPVFQADMLYMLKQTGRPEMVVGWYHSHPGFGCWLSRVDINTQQSFEALSKRAIAVVIDPIQSVKGKVVIDAFRLINPNTLILRQEPRQVTSNLGHLREPSIQALCHGLNRLYYSININYRKNELEQKMLLNLNKKTWMDGLTLENYSEHCKLNENSLEDEENLTKEELAIKRMGNQDPKRHLEENVEKLMLLLIQLILERTILKNGGPLEESDEETVIDVPIADTAEQVLISSLALMKMLKHGRAGVPMEVMGLMLGEFIDDYTVRVVDVFAIPQIGTGVSVEAVDSVFQADMLQMLKQTGRPEMVVGWYHSHPGFGCWLSNIDINTQQSFEALSKRAIAVVIDPIQSVRGKVVIDAFRLINPDIILTKQESRQVTSNLGHLRKACKKALVHGLNLHYYSICINYRKNELEQKMLLNLHKKTWMDCLTLTKYSEQSKFNDDTVQEMLKLMKNYKKSLEDEEMLTPEQLAIRHIGSQDPKRHLEQKVDTLMSSNIVQCLGAMLDTVAETLVRTCGLREKPAHPKLGLNDTIPTTVSSTVRGPPESP